jgi:hypothetical protein
MIATGIFFVVVHIVGVVAVVVVTVAVCCDILRLRHFLGVALAGHGAGIFIHFNISCCSLAFLPLNRQ